MPMALALQAFDAALLDSYLQMRQLLPGEDEAVVQRRFAQYGVFPKLGWPLIAEGEAQALAAQDPGLLHGTLLRFLKCAHHCWGVADESGLHWGGADFCATVVHSLHSAALGGDYIAAVFHRARPMSKTGHAPLVHAANLMLSLQCRDWPHCQAALTRAQAFVAKRMPGADQAFVAFFLALLDQDRTRVADSLLAFADHYGRSDWGRHKPDTQAALIQGMLAFAQRHAPAAVDADLQRRLASAERIALWAALADSLQALQRTPHRFAAPLDFLNPLPSA